MKSPGPDGRLDVLLLGPVSPPFGGVSSHIERLRLLLPLHGLRVGVLSHYSAPPADSDILGALNRNPLRYWASVRRHKSRIVHYHHSHWSLLIAVGLASRGDFRRYAVTIHGHELLMALDSPNRLVAHLTRWAVRQFDDVIAVSEEVAGGIRPYVDPRRLHTIPAFLSPGPEEAVGLHPRNEEFFREGSPVLVVSCSQFRSGPQASDIYGLDLAVEAFCAIAAQVPAMKLALFLGRQPSTQGERNYVRDLQQRILARGIGSRLLVLVQAPLLPAFSHDVIYLRPTRKDGDAVSIREALSMNVPVLASDVVRRPAGTLTFRSEDAESLCSELTGLLRRRRGRGDQAADSAGQHHQPASMLESLLAVYDAPNGGSR